MGVDGKDESDLTFTKDFLRIGVGCEVGDLIVELRLEFLRFVEIDC